MITTPEQYKANLHLLQNFHAPQFFPMNTVDMEKVYEVDLNTRIIEAPDFISVIEDHASEVIYFSVPRFYDYMDLATMTCLIEYVNAKGESGIYAVPFYDIQTLANKEKPTESKMIVPWVINSQVSAAAGTIQFQICFYNIQVENLKDENGAPTNKYEYAYTYLLSTQVAKTKILPGMKLSDLLDVSAPEQWPGVEGEETPVLPQNPTPEDVWLALNQKIQQVAQWQVTPTMWVTL